MRIKLLAFLILFNLIFSGCPKKTGQCTVDIPEIPPPEPETVIIKEVPRPSNVIQWSAPRFTPDYEWISFSFLDINNPQVKNIGIIKEDGTGFQCLTCSLGINAGGIPVWFPDNQKFIFQCVPLQPIPIISNPFCIYDKNTPDKYYPIQNITSPDELTHDRVYILSPDGKKLVWTKVRMDGFHMVMGDIVGDSVNGYSVENIRVLYPPPVTDMDNAEQWARANAWYEAKSFTDGGRTLVFASTRDQGGNLDVYTMNLEDGEIKRITNHPEWDEGADYSPDGNWLVFETTRAHEVLSVIADIPVPPFIDFALVQPVTAATLTGEWYAPHEVYLLDKYGDRGDYYGQRLSNEGDEGWAVRGHAQWNGDGTKVVWGAYLNPTQDNSHIIVASFTSRTPSQQLPIVPTPSPSWAPFLKDVPLRSSNIHKIFAGKSSGVVSLDIEGTILSGNFSMSFDNYSDDGENIIDGSMEIVIPVLGTAQWTGEMKLSGCHKGFLDININIVGEEVSGSIVSERDGERHEKNF